MTKAAKPVPRPVFTQEIADEICHRLAHGDSLRKICGVDRDDFLPGQTTVYKWLDENEEFAKQYARARELQGDTKFDQAWEVAESATPESVSVARLQFDALRWQAGKLAPKRYGDKVALVGGDPAQGDRPVQAEIITRFIRPGDAPEAS